MYIMEKYGHNMARETGKNNLDNHKINDIINA